MTIEEPQQLSDGEVERGPTSESPRGSNLKLALVAALTVTVLVAGLFVILATRNNAQPNTSSPIRVSGLPASISTPLANLMALSPIPNIPAHAFTLTDQRGRSLSLATFKGRVVVLDFMDPHCIDICPIVSQELIDAYKGLGTQASHVVFLAVNINRFHTNVAAIRQFTNEHLLSSIPSWHFMTGAPKVLKPIWADYGVTVVAPSPTTDVIHSSFIYFINQKGQERYLANPTDFHTAGGKAFLPANPLAAWGRGIALVIRSMLN